MRREVAVQDLRALLEYLTASNAQYALAGGLAVGLWAEHLLKDDQKEKLKIPFTARMWIFGDIVFWPMVSRLG